MQPLITNDAIVFGLLIAIIAFTFYTASLPSIFWQKFYSLFPSILICYFLPGLLNSFGIVSGEASKLYDVASKYLLPACLVYFTINIDFRALQKLGPKAIIVFLAGSLGVMVGGPVAIGIVKIISPETVSGETWRGLATIAGSWIGGSANQTALKEVFEPSAEVFSQAIAVDVVTAELWLAVLLYGVAYASKLDKWLGADTQAVEEIRVKMEADFAKNQQNPSLQDLMMILLVGFGTTAIAHTCADGIVPFISQNFPALKKFSLTSSSFWVISLVTLFGLILSQTPARNIEKVGASKFGSLFLYILIATIGMKMDILAALDKPQLFLVGIIWMFFHASFTLLAAYITKAPFFFTAVGSQANVGGAASASVIAAAFHPSLASVGVLLAILGYALGTYCGYLTGLMMQWVAQ
ncbi:DUF819 family protein [Flectobacillus major]|uniref:DUF819 family protein n=1 Tax=Flectobacillus major TaxID=103 RepID=UPI0003F7B0E6|nr:DUF819 family protein [Flectobacillus major]